MTKIEWWEPQVGEKEKALLCKVIDSNFINDGGETTRFEQALAARLGAKHAVAVTSGTSALFLSLAALGIGHGDEVIVPDVTFIASANAVTMAGATPVLVDVDPATLCLDPQALIQAITAHTKAIMPVHLSGRCAAMPEILSLAQQRGLAVVEDAAEALQSRNHGKYLGTHGALGCVSFSPNKTITTGQGGMIFTDDEALHARLRELKDQGRPVRGTGGNDTHLSVGYNFKLTNLQAAVGLAQLEALDARLERMRATARLYKERLSGVAGLSLFPADLDAGEVPQWVDCMCPQRDLLLTHLRSLGIECREFWHPLHTQAPYRLPDEDFPVASKLVPQSFWLPSAFTLTDADVHLVCDRIIDWLHKHGEDS